MYKKQLNCTLQKLNRLDMMVYLILPNLTCYGIEAHLDRSWLYRRRMSVLLLVHSEGTGAG